MNSSNKPIVVNVDIGDRLTAISCGHIIVELIKFISYQRLQIPYSYEWLKQVVTKKRERVCEESKDSFHSQMHFRTVSTALDNLDFIIKFARYQLSGTIETLLVTMLNCFSKESVQQEINSPSLPDEVCIAIGSTPVTCKEVYRVLLPTVCHKPQCHSKNIANDQIIRRSVFRMLATSEELTEVFFSLTTPTNLYVFIKKKVQGHLDNIMNIDNFVLTSGCRLPRNCKIIVINLRTKSLDNVACCNEFNVFGDIVNSDLKKLQLEDIDENDAYNEIESTDDSQWYQSSYVMKGFNDHFINGSSITNLWLNS